jgi:hypothetical protein
MDNRPEPFVGKSHHGIDDLLARSGVAEKGLAVFVVQSEINDRPNPFIRESHHGVDGKRTRPSLA